MNRSRTWPALAVAFLASASVPLVARAQSPGTMAPGTGPGGTIGEEEPKKEGAAEKAPKEGSQLPTLPPLPPYPGQEKKKFELITLDGYMRLRANWYDNYSMGFHDPASGGQGVPFREPLACKADVPTTTTGSTTQPVTHGSCGSSVGSSNMRVRLEPTIHLSESVALHMQIDALDNIVLGSTPDGVTLNGGGVNRTTLTNTVPASVTTSNQVSPEAGKNSPWSSIRVKQAWGDVKTPLGSLQFGRMPNQWGLGIFANAGGYDWIHGTTCTDCDYGDTVDRVMFGTTIPGTSVRAAIAADWAASGVTSGQSDAWKLRQDGQPFDLEDSDDVTEYAIMLTHIDDPEDWNLAVKQGKTLFNYGAYFVYRSQDFETPGATFGDPAPETTFVSRHATMYIPDVWARFTSGKLTLEAEAVGQFGSVDNLVDPTKSQMDFRQLGGVFKLNYLMVGDDLDLGLEIGSASGDQWENKLEPGIINVHDTSYYPSDASATNITNFRFSFDYRPDLIFFREILGAVTNATYFKPTIRYNITERFAFRAQGIVSFANVPEATPGNGSMYGIELDGDLGYSNVREGFFAGVSYGAFFPLSALDHPVAIFPNETNNGAGTAQTIQGRVVLKF
jgi:uncharacterized protein (TIGR04551 family)